MRLLLKLFFLGVALAPLAAIGMVLLAIDKHPTVDRVAEITPQNIERAKRILDQNDPRRLKSGARQTITVSRKDLDLAANYLVHRYGHGSARVSLGDKAAQINASARLPENPFGSFVNVEATLRENGSVPRLQHLRIGGVSLPGSFAEWIITQFLTRWLGDENYATALNAVKQVNLDDNKISVLYEWQSDLPDKLRSALMKPGDQERLRIYNQQLAEISRSLRGESVSLVNLLVPMFKLADQRSATGDAVAENRAAILVLTLYVNGQPLTAVLPDAKHWPVPRKHIVTLNRRDDFPKHFIISAALSANAGGPLSDAVGVYKEIADSRGGSGFSFNDIAADRAGTRFGEWAESPRFAKTLQQRIAGGVIERDLMPVTQDLPEFMPEAEFVRRFGGVNGPAYRKMMAEIERRIAALSLYR